MAGVGPLGENVNAQLIREAAVRTARKGGSESRMRSLAFALVVEFQRRVTDGADPDVLKASVSQAVEAVVGELAAIARGINGPEQVAAVAATALRKPPGRPTKPPYKPWPKPQTQPHIQPQPPLQPQPQPQPAPDNETARALGAIIAEAIDKVGVDGDISVARNDHPESELKLERVIGRDRRLAVIKVAASSDEEFNARRLAIEHALRAVRAARADGIVKGGAEALLQVAEMAFERLGRSDDQEAGAAVLRAAISLAEASGENADRIPGELLPVKGVRSELRNAALVAERYFGTGVLGPGTAYMDLIVMPSVERLRVEEQHGKEQHGVTNWFPLGRPEITGQGT